MLANIVAAGALALLSSAPGWAQASAPAAPASVTLDPARLAASKQIAAALMPAGTYRKLMSGTFNNLISSMSGQMSQLPIRELLAAAGADAKDQPKISPATIGEVMAVIDPVYQQRMDLGMQAMLGKMTDLMESYEPEFRDGIAEAYARHYDVAQLGDIQRFFSTPTGKDFASNLMLLNADPAVMSRMQNMMPKIMQQMPAMLNAMQEATKDLPKRKQYKDLTPAERAKLASLLGLDPKTMK